MLAELNCKKIENWPFWIAAAEGELTRLDRAERARPLGTVPAGRPIFTMNALPVVRPMNFTLAAGLIVLRPRRTLRWPAS